MTSEPLTVEELERLGITIDQMVMSGQPVIKGTRIPASTIAARFFGGKSIVYLAKDHNIRFDQVEAAIRWHLESHSRQLWLEAAEIPMEWANSKSCDYHDSSPCCHVRTGAEIARRLRAKAESTPKPSPALPEKP